MPTPFAQTPPESTLTSLVGCRSEYRRARYSEPVGSNSPREAALSIGLAGGLFFGYVFASSVVTMLLFGVAGMALALILEGGIRVMKHRRRRT
jgi:hypothetical protein